MPATLENIKGRDLPPAWKRKAQIKDDDTVSVTITRQKHSATLPQKKPRFDMAEVQRILDRVDKLPILDDRSPDAIIGYDEFGLLK